MNQDVVIRLRLDDSGMPAPVQRTTAAIASIGKAGEVSARQTAAAMRQLPAQLTDVATQLAGGANPLLVLLQQGGQVKDSFGGVGAAIRGLGAAISPMSVVLGAAAAGVAAIGVAAVQGAQETAQLRDTLALSGNAAGLTGARFQALAEQVAESTNSTVSNTKQILLALAQSGQVSNEALASTAMAVARVAAVSGQDAAKVAADFVTMGNGVAKWAAEHNKAWNFISLEQFKNIELTEKQLGAQRAMIEVNGIVVEHLKGQREELGFIDQLLEWGANKWAKWWDAAKGVGRKDSIADLIKEERAAIAEMTKDGEPAVGTFSSGRIQAARLRLAMLAEQAKQEAAVADRLSEAAPKNRQAIDDRLKGGKNEREGRRFESRLGSLDMIDAPFAAEMQRLEKEEAAASQIDAFFDEQLRKQDERDARRFDNAVGFLEDLRSANQRAAIDLIADERARAEAVIRIDLKTASQRIRIRQDLTDAEKDEAVRLYEERARLAIRKLDGDESRAAQKVAEEAGRSVYTETRGALIAAFQDTDNPLRAFGNALYSTILTRATAGIADAMAAAAVGQDGRSGMLGELLKLFGGGSGSGSGSLWNDTTSYTSDPYVVTGSFAVGTNYVPRNMIAQIHEGEAIVPKRFNPWAGGSGAGAGITVNQNVTVKIDARADAQQVAGLAMAAVRQGNEALMSELQSRGVLR